MNSRVLLLASLFGGIITLSTKAQTITAPTGQNLTITNPIDVTGSGNTVNIPIDGSYKIGGISMVRSIGTQNLFLGANTGNVNTGNANLFVGSGAGLQNTSGSSNMFLGGLSGYSNTLGSFNAFIGVYAGHTNSSGSYNVFIGSNAGQQNSSGEHNTFIGFNSGITTTTGKYNTFIGSGAGGANVLSNDNTFIGISAGLQSTGGDRNIFIGSNAGYSNITGSDNIGIGKVAGPATGNLTNVVAIGNYVQASVSNTVVLGNDATTITGQGPNMGGKSGLRFANLSSGSGTTSVPGGKVLSVDGSGNVVLVQLSTTPGQTNSVGGPVAEKTWKEDSGYLYNNSTNGVVINGTGLDGNSLIVKGGVLSKEVNVKVDGSESWPDYVFKPSYKRMTLDEVEKFININGHLPNVASATEMVATGNNLNKTDIKLLEKVEELTLYLLEMKKANEVQNAEIQNLKKQVKSLRKK